MGVPEGVDNFKNYRNSKIDASLKLLRVALDDVKKGKKKFTTKSDLVNEMSERTGIHRTTLGRNEAYLREIMKHLTSQAGASTFVIPEDATPELLRQMVIDAKLENSQLKAKLEKRERQERAATNSSPTSQLAFADTVFVLMKVLDRMNTPEPLFRVDLEKGQILDLAEDPGARQVVVSGPRLKHFIEAMKTWQEQKR
ncbi:hypothetical protein [Herbaspirillum chlorophenolicum]|uniref:hypothetical protein n=1 Tax=Herbaspirillum chlorophenolicum TaxID=211589 RepID=UPI00067DEC0C|nr:hypothetical protein [Herbaspirillum chlorophenolicum]